MNALRVGNDYWINADDMVIVQPWPSRKATRERERAEEKGAFYNATTYTQKVRQPIRSLITLQNGWVVASPLHPRALVRRRVVVAATVSTPPKEPRHNSAPPKDEIADTTPSAREKASALETSKHHANEENDDEAEFIADESSTRSSRRWPFRRS